MKVTAAVDFIISGVPGKEISVLFRPARISSKAMCKGRAPARSKSDCQIAEACLLYIPMAMRTKHGNVPSYIFTPILVTKFGHKQFNYIQSSVHVKATTFVVMQK